MLKRAKDKNKIVASAMSGPKKGAAAWCFGS